MPTKPPADPGDVPIVVETRVDADPYGEPSRDWLDAPSVYHGIYRNAWGTVKALVNLRVKGIENVPTEGALIVAVNHVSYADPIHIGVAFPRPIHWLAKQEVFNGERWTKFFSSAGVVPVNRQAKGSNQAALQAAVDNLAAGKVAGIFPEGKRSSTPGELAPTKTGIARLAFLSGAPVLPMGLATDKYWPKGQVFPKLGTRCALAIGKPMRFPHEPEWADDKAVCRRATDEVMTEVDRLYQEARRARDAGASGGGWEKPRKIESGGRK